MWWKGNKNNSWQSLPNLWDTWKKLQKIIVLTEQNVNNEEMEGKNDKGWGDFGKRIQINSTWKNALPR